MVEECDQRFVGGHTILIEHISGSESAGKADESHIDTNSAPAYKGWSLSTVFYF
jgi:hypothetical protein